MHSVSDVYPSNFLNFYQSRLHIRFERLDTAKDYDAIKSIIKMDRGTAMFFRHHVAMCGDMFRWNFKREAPNLLEDPSEESRKEADVSST